jgi:ankyrin repeat protein
MFHTLPRSPDLAHLRDEAKTLKKRTAAGDPEAIAFVEFHVGGASARSAPATGAPAAQSASIPSPGKFSGPIKLADVQFALARAYGFKSWPRLKAFVEAQAHTPAERGDLLLKELFGDNWPLRQELYERRAELPADNIFVAAVLGNVAAVESLLAADPTLAQRVGGPKKTQAITYAAHARFFLVDDTYLTRQQRIIELLLANGADPNSAAPNEDGDGRGRLSALYGCCRQPGNPAVAKMLLDAGANPDDGESLYHSSELADTTCLELVLAAGVPDQHREFCIVRALDEENPAAVAVYLKYGTNPNHLHWALFRQRSLAVIQLLVEHGADVNEICKKHWLLGRIEGLTPVQVAERAGSSEIVQYLLAHGATDNRTPADRLIGACWRQDLDAVRTILEEHPGVVASMTSREHSNVATAARAGRLKVVQLMLDAGLDMEVPADDLNATGLLYAATTGDAPMVEMFLRRGARIDVKHSYGGQPLGSAIYCAAHFNPDRTTYAKTVRLLLDAGCVPRAKDLELALEHHLDDIVDVLKEHGTSL